MGRGPGEARSGDDADHDSVEQRIEASTQRRRRRDAGGTYRPRLERTRRDFRRRCRSRDRPSALHHLDGARRTPARAGRRGNAAARRRARRRQGRVLDRRHAVGIGRVSTLYDTLRPGGPGRTNGRNYREGHRRLRRPFRVYQHNQAQRPIPRLHFTIALISYCQTGSGFGRGNSAVRHNLARQGHRAAGSVPQIGNRPTIAIELLE